MRATIISVAMLAASSASAQAVIDDSNAGLSKAQLGEMVSAVTADFLDPSAAQFKGLTRPAQGYYPERTICGFVNGKNSFGGYVGFRPFVYDSLNRVGFVSGGTDIAAEMANSAFMSSGCRSALGVSP